MVDMLREQPGWEGGRFVLLDQAAAEPTLVHEAARAVPATA